ncbi:MAG: YbaB/EbfC family nucleoid-associated protein [Spirochaetaceae bacterium]|nr:MAG: YbaB/EbfC family nucleoid-associated protein [Spirochaetaceae bacterium]
MNPMDLMKNFQNIQSKVQEAQERLKTIRATGSAGGDMVRVEISGEFTVLNVTIAPEVVDPADITMLEDLVRAAFTDAVANIKDRVREEMSALTGGLEIPPGFMGM